MPMKQTGRKVYKTMQTVKPLIWIYYVNATNLTPAVGNAKVNGRGDELGPGGKIIRKKEDMLADYYQSNPGVRDEQPVAKGQPTSQKNTAEWL